MINVNLLGEIYVDSSNRVLTLVDTELNNLLYLEVSSSRKVLVYPVFVNDSPQMIYETLDRSKFRKLSDRKNSLINYGIKETISVETHRKLLHKRVNDFQECSYSSTLFDDFCKGSTLDWYDRFPSYLNQNIDIVKRDRFNRIFSGKVLGKDIFIGTDFIKVVVDRAYKTSNNNILIKRKPEDTFMLGNENKNICLSAIKFKTKDIVEIFDLVQDIELIENYSVSEDYKNDLINKATFAKKLIDTQSYGSAMMSHKILKVLALTMHRCDLAYQHKLTKDIVVNIITGNVAYFGNYVEDINKTLGNDIMLYLRNIYVRSEYRDSLLGVDMRV